MGLPEEVAKGAASGVGSAAGGKAVDKVTPDGSSKEKSWQITFSHPRLGKQKARLTVPPSVTDKDEAIYACKLRIYQDHPDLNDSRLKVEKAEQVEV